MKRLSAVLLGCLLLCSLVSAQAGGPDGSELLNVSVEGVQYVLGSSTAEDFAANGWSYSIENDGTYSFSSPSRGSWFYGRTRNGAPGDPVTALDLTWAEGVKVRYCGFNLDDDPDGGNEGFWSWMIDQAGARPNEEGALVTCIPLNDGRMVQVETVGIRVKMALLYTR